MNAETDNPRPLRYYVIAFVLGLGVVGFSLLFLYSVFSWSRTFKSVKKVQFMERKGLDEASQRSVIMLNVGGMIIVLATFGLTWLIISFLNIDLRRLTLLAAYRILLLIFLFVSALPLSVFGEYWLSNYRKRAFLWKSVATAVGLVAAFGLASTLVSLLFDILFPGRNIVFQLPFLAVSNIVGLLVMALTIRNERFKKWQKDLGWYPTL